MEYSQNSTNDVPVNSVYKIDSIPHATAAEEKVLWRNYIKCRCIKRILGPESFFDKKSYFDNIHNTSSLVISRIVEEISSSHDLIVLLRRHSGLEELGDTIIEDDEHNVRYMTEVARLIFIHKEKKRDEKIKQKNSMTCCLEDIFGSIFRDILNNIAFGKGNPNLVGKVVKAINADPDDIKGKLYKLAINRDLLPRSILKFLSPKTPLIELPNLVKSVPPDSFSEFVTHYYQPFIINIKAEGEKALNRLIESHLWLVVDIVNKYFHEDLGLPLDDLIQEGNLGLIEAAERFEPTLSTRYMSYARWWIYQKISRAIADQARTIRVPVHMIDTINKLLGVAHRLAQEYGREPRIEEIGEEMELSPEKVKEIMVVAQLPVSLYSPVSEEEESYLSDDIEDKYSLPLVDAASKQLLKIQIDTVLSSLSPREQRVLELRFVLKDGRSRTLEEVGKEFNVTRERIRQIEAKALRRLRHPSRSRKLKEYLE
jgi:RNA polymerase sigma factor (sigma-70 family)